MVGTFSIVSGSLVMLSIAISASQLLVGSSQDYISIGCRDKSLPNFLFLQEMRNYVESIAVRLFQLDFKGLLVYFVLLY